MNNYNVELLIYVCMKKITKKSLSELRYEFSELSISMQRSIIGGVGYDCLISAIGLACSELGADPDIDAITKEAYKVVRDSNPMYANYTDDQIAFEIFSKGLTNNQSTQLLENVFNKCVTSTGSNSGEGPMVTIVAFFTEEIDLKTGKRVAHAGVLRDYGNGDYKVWDGKKEYALTDENMAFGYNAVCVNEGYSY